MAAPIKKKNRIDLFRQLSKGVESQGTIAHVSRKFLQELKAHLNFSGIEVATLFGVSRPAVSRKMKDKDAIEKEPITALPADDSGEMDLEDFMNARLTPEDELKFLKGYGRRMLETLPLKSQARISLYRSLVEASEKRLKEEGEEGNELLRAFLKECTEAFSEAREKMQVEFKKQISRVTTLFLVELTANPETDPVSIRNALLIQVEAFDTGSLVKDVFMSKPNLKRKMDEYVARREDMKPPSLLGGGVVSRQGEGSETGGAQYKQAERRLEREKEKD